MFIQAPTPASLQVFNDFYVKQNFNDYDRERHYQVKDNAGNNWQRVGNVTESYSAYSNNGCNLPPVSTGTATTNTSGQFKDNYFMSGSTVCPSNPNCTSTTTQTLWVDGHQVAQYTVTYGCSSVSVQ